MTLYHGTASNLAPDILKRGLVPVSVSPKLKAHKFQSTSDLVAALGLPDDTDDYVYLARDPVIAHWYADLRARLERLPRGVHTVTIPWTFRADDLRYLTETGERAWAKEMVKHTPAARSAHPTVLKVDFPAAFAPDLESDPHEATQTDALRYPGAIPARFVSVLQEYPFRHRDRNPLRELGI